MKLELEVLASTNIKRKKPWPKIFWVGEEKESLLLLDNLSHRLSVLYVPSGNTKRKINKLSPLLENAEIITKTRNGRYVVGLLKNGEVFLWHKDQDILKSVHGLETIISHEDFVHGKTAIFSSDDCEHIIVILGTTHIYIWNRDQVESVLESRVPDIRGTWNLVTVPPEVGIPRHDDCPECCVEGVFFSHQNLGYCSQISFVFNKDKGISIVTVLLSFNKDDKKRLPPVNVEWTVIQYPIKLIHPSSKPVYTDGAFVARYANNGQVIAIAANQENPLHTGILFASPLCDTVLPVSLKGCGSRDPYKQSGRDFWVSDMEWTCDSLFLACSINNGCVCLLTRLGEPLVIQLMGQSMDMGPSHFLPIHPLIIVRGEENLVHSSPQAQKFSVSTHPNLPIILFSDGFMVTVVQFRADVTCVRLMKKFVLTSAKHLKEISEMANLDVTLTEAFRLPSERDDSSARSGAKRRHFKFEDDRGQDQDSDTSFLDHEDPYTGLNAGKIEFSEAGLSVMDSGDFSGLSGPETLFKHIETAENALFSSWKLATSYTDSWQADIDKITKQVSHNFIKLFTIHLECRDIDAILSHHRNASVAAQNPRLFSVITIYKRAMELLRFDIINKHLMPVSLKLAYDTINLMLTSTELQRTDPRLKTLSGCYALLKFTEEMLNKVYMWTHGDEIYSGLPLESRSDQKHAYQPAVVTNLSPRAHASPRTNEVDYAAVEQLSGVISPRHGKQLPGKRLCGSWKLLYRSLTHYQKYLQQNPVSGKEREQLMNLMFAVEQNIKQNDGSVPTQVTPTITQGEHFSLGGKHTMAIDAWREELKNISDGPEDVEKKSQILHAVLYTHLLKDQLGQAIDFVDELIIHSNVMSSQNLRLPQFRLGAEKPSLMTIVTDTMKSQHSGTQTMVPCIHDKSVRQLVQSMARFMCSYFCNQPVYVLPPHSPQPLPCIHMASDKQKNNRIIPKYHEDISGVISKAGLSKTWTTDRAMEYLLLSGLLCEATWFADKMGDWKAGLLLSVACINHRIMSPKLYKKKIKPFMLPDNLSPGAILQDKLEALIHMEKDTQEQKQDFIPINNETNIVQLTKTMEDLLKAGVISGVEIMPWLLSSLVDRLKGVVNKLHPLVPQGFYLPAPPLYCPQPADTDEDSVATDVAMEKTLRYEISSIVQLILIVLNASHVSLPATRWYIQQLVGVQDKAAQFKATTEGPCTELPEILQPYGTVPSTLSETEPGVVQILSSYRDFITVLWLLHARDTLSKKLRQKESYLNDVNYQDYLRASWDDKQGDQWMKECFTTLQWAVHMIAFSRFLPEEECVYKIALSLLQELKPSEDTADILAEYFYDEENLDSEVQDKLNKIIQEWQGVMIEHEDDGKSARPDQDSADMNDTDQDNEGRKSVTFFQASPRGKTLSVYYFKQCEVVCKVLKKRRKVFGGYEEFVFDGNTNPNEVSSSLKNHGLNPGSRPFEAKLSFLEFLDNFVAVSFTKIVDEEREQKVVIPPLLLPFSEDIWTMELENLVSRSNLPDQEKKQSLIVMASPRAQGNSVSPRRNGEVRKGLFRSVSESNDVGRKGGMNRFMSEGGGLNYIPENELGKEYRSPNQSPNRMKGKMTGLVSRFSESEVVLYRDPSHDPDTEWTLDVDFGKRYHHLQNILHWFSEWGKKHHSLGLEWKGEKDLSFRPKMKIDAPVELVVLTVWLLDNKYSPYGKPSQRSLPRQQPRQEEVREEAVKVSVTMKESVKMLQSTGESSRRRWSKPKPNRNMSASLQSNTSEKDWENEYDQEADEVHTEYEKVLDVKEDSSSLEVSSLEPDEYDPSLRSTLSYIKRSGEARNQRKSPRRDRSGERRRQSSSDRRQSSGERRRYDVRQDSRDRYHGSNSSNINHGDLAHQLQDIVRGEMRKIMEAQHRSMMAMMSALDGHTLPPEHHYLHLQGRGHDRSSRGYPHDPRQPDSSLRRHQSSRDDRGRRSPSLEGNRRHASESPRRPLPVEDHMTRSMGMDELHTTPSGRRRAPERGIYDGALKELNSLRETTNRQKSKSPHRQQLYRSEVNKENYSTDQPENVHFIPRMLRLQAERDEPEFRLPPIPVPAWEERPRQMAPQIGVDFGMPLLSVNAAYTESNLFPGYNRLPQGPPPPPFGLHSQPPPDNRPLPPMYQNMFQRMEQRVSEGVAKMDMPLLSLPKDRDLLGPSDAAFGRLLDPNLIISHEQEIKQKELLRHKNNLDFLRSQVENLEQLEKEEEEKGKKLLTVDLRRQEMKEKHEVDRQERVERGRARRRKARPQKPVSPDKLSQEQTTDDRESPAEGSAEELEGETTEDQIHDGYAIKPGSYENYLHMDKQVGFEEDTNARIQYRTAMILKKQRKKVDFSTMTHNVEDAEMETDPAMEREYVRTAEAATSITKDTGVDPIQEAIVEYNRARQGNALPPDIYLGLRFGETEQQPTSDVTSKGKEKPKGRSYLNVVDLDASALLNDLHEKPGKAEKVQNDLALQPTSVTLTSARDGWEAMESTLREALEPKVVRPFKQDSVTVKMFETKARDQDRLSIAVMPRDSVTGTRASIINRLRDMNQQIHAIDQMSENIEKGFHGTRMLISTLEHMAEIEDTGLPGTDDRKSETLTPKKSQKSPKRSARSTARSTARSSGKSSRGSTSPVQNASSKELVKLSGLSGISDIIGEMVEKGDIDLEEAGFEPDEAKFIVNKMKHSARRAESPAQQERLRKSLEKLEHYAQTQEDNDEERSAERKEELRRWMAEKRAEKMEEYKRHLQDLREHEHKPFQALPDTFKATHTPSDLKDRKEHHRMDMTKRMQEAQELIIEALRDKPELPPEPVYRERSPKRKPGLKDTSPSRTRMISPGRDRSPMGSSRWQSPGRKPGERSTVTISPKVSRKVYHADQRIQEIRQPQPSSMRQPSPVRQPRPQPIMVQPAEQPVVPKLRLIDSDEFMRRSHETTGTGEYLAYARAMADMEVTQSQDKYTPKPRPTSPPPKPAGKPYKPKSFKDLVRLQDPSKLRNRQASRIPVPLDYHDDYPSGEYKPRDCSPEEKGERIYGSKRAPMAKDVNPSPRTVKTYTERLQEMKSKKTYDTPIIPRSHIPGGGKTVKISSTVMRRKTGPPHKPMTYVEQLQKMNQGAPKSTPKPGMRTYVRPQKFMKSHKPIHKPRTYTEQLQTLQPPKAQKISPARKRARPYPGPYRGEEQWEGDSVLSDWSVDDRVKNILYGGEDASTMYGSRVSLSHEYPMSENVSDYYDDVMGEHYIDSVDIDEIMQIADVASVGSGDVMSVIDWDAVDDLINDVH